MRQIQYREALREALVEEMERDDRVFLMGEEVAEYNGAYKVSQGMLEKFGPRRVVDTPISETAFSGLGIGAAMYGLSPVIEFMSWSFSLVAADQILNNAPRCSTCPAANSKSPSSSAATTVLAASSARRIRGPLSPCSPRFPGQR